MKWPVRKQVFVAFVLLLLTAIVLITAFNVYFAVERERKMAVEQVARASQFLQEANFPLTAKILDDMKYLSNADFVTWSPVRRQTIATLNISDEELAALNAKPAGNISSLADLDQVELNQQEYYHIAIDRTLPNDRRLIHVLYSRENVRLLWWRAARPPLFFAAVALPIVLLASLGLSSKITGPIGRLKQQVDQIASGNHVPLPIEGPDDEVRQLSNAVNIMVEQLAAQEQNIRETERLSTLVRMGQGIAHNLRNCATGCRMAIDLHEHDLNRARTSDSSSDESLQVARRQLSLMDGYIRRFIRVSDPDGSPPAEKKIVNVARAAAESIKLIAPMAEHLHVDFQQVFQDTDVEVYIAEEDLEQLIVNLVTNAVQAVSEHSALDAGKSVQLVVGREDQQATLAVIDSGPGPDPAVVDDLFKPFVSGRQTGIGLGLALCQEIVEDTGGKISWSRENGLTKFIVTLPRHPSEPT